jgi:hypothetical protein
MTDFARRCLKAMSLDTKKRKAFEMTGINFVLVEIQSIFTWKRVDSEFKAPGFLILFHVALHLFFVFESSIALLARQLQR